MDVYFFFILIYFWSSSTHTNLFAFQVFHSLSTLFPPNQTRGSGEVGERNFKEHAPIITRTRLKEEASEQFLV